MTASDADRTIAARGRLKVYLGAAPGSGKTYAMLLEAHNRRSQGEDVVAGFVESYGRPRTMAALDALEVVPRLSIDYKGTVQEEMDLGAVLARRPEVVLVDELAHTNIPGSVHEKRWQDVDALLASGIDVVTTVNVQHLESVKDLVEQISQIPVRETVPDSVVDGADDIQFIDIAPEALRKRMRHGNIYPKERIETALNNFFRVGNLAALREIALRLVATRVGTHESAGVVMPEDVVVAVAPRADEEGLIRRGARIARRFNGFCTVVCVIKDPAENYPDLARLSEVCTQLRCLFVVREAKDVATEIAQVAEGGSRHLVIGEGSAGAMAPLRPTLVDRLLDALPDVNVHIIARFRTRRPEGDGRPAPDEILRRVQASGRRATLRVYLGYAHGVGTTKAMLDEAQRRADRGTDVVVGSVDPICISRLERLELLGGPKGAGARGELDLPALLARNPEVVCVDELNAPLTHGGQVSDHVAQVLDAGITIIATMHLTDLASTATTLGALVPRSGDHVVIDDKILELADEMELVDIVPVALQERVRDGEVGNVRDAATALQGEFRTSVLATLREMCFRVIAQHTDRQLMRYMREKDIEQPWEARGRVVLCLPPETGLESVIRQTAAVAARSDSEFHVITVRTKKLGTALQHTMGEYSILAHELGGDLVTLYGDSVASQIAEYAEGHLATEIVMVRSPRRARRRKFGPSTLRTLIHMLSDVDIHLVSSIR